MPGINTADGIEVIVLDGTTGLPVSFGAGGTASQVEGTTAQGASYTSPSLNPVLIGWGNNDNALLNQWIGGGIADGTTWTASMPWVQVLMRRRNQSGTWDRTYSYIGTQANAWSAASVSANGTSTAIDMGQAAVISAFGNTSATTTITVQFSQDNTNFYDSATTVVANGNFGITFNHGARYVRLKSSAAATITATLAGKGL